MDASFTSISSGQSYKSSYINIKTHDPWELIFVSLTVPYTYRYHSGCEVLVLCFHSIICSTQIVQILMTKQATGLEGAGPHILQSSAQKMKTLKLSASKTGTEN